MMNESDYSEIGLMKRWQAVRRNDWRGWEIVGTADQKIVVQFIPDEAIRVLDEIRHAAPGEGESDE